MKRLALIMVCTLAMTGVVSAQGRNRQRDGEPIPRVPVETLTVTGTLTLAQGMTAVVSDGITYLVPGLIRYAGFINGLTEGARVTLEGRAFSDRRDTSVQYLLPSKMTISGKDYDLAWPRMSARNRPQSRHGFTPRQPARPRKTDPRTTAD